jgi:hypothetical protein
LHLRKHGDTIDEYVDIVESRRLHGKVVQTTLGSLGRRDQLRPEKRRSTALSSTCASWPPQKVWAASVWARCRSTRSESTVGSPAGSGKSWGWIGCSAGFFHPASIDLEEAVFRMVAPRLCDPTSKLGAGELDR